MTETLADYCVTGASCSLQRFTKYVCNHNSLPLYVSIRKKGIHLRNSRSQRLVYVHERKMIPFALCVSEKNGSPYAIPLGKEAGVRLLPAARCWNPACIHPNELLACKKSPASILLVSKSFVASEKGLASGAGVLLKEGALLFPQTIKSKKKVCPFMLAKTESGLDVTIDFKCTGRFSVSFGPDFDLVNILKTFEGMIKLPMEVSFCKRGTTETIVGTGVAALEEIREEWALCGMTTGELGEEKGKVQFMYKAELPATLPYTAQKMVPRDPHSRTALQLRASYKKAMSSHGIESTCDVASLDIYEAVEVALAANPAYGSCGGGAASEYPLSHLPPAECEGSHKLQAPPRDWRFDSQETNHSRPAQKLPPSHCSPALSIMNTLSRKHPQSSQVLKEVNTGSSPRDFSHSKVAQTIPIDESSSKAYPGPLVNRSASDVPSCDTVSPGRNVAFLKSLDTHMVQTLLVGMNLSEHRDRFQAEHVDGEILASCDVECLQDLGVTRRIQQIRLTKLIDGTQSASKFLKE